MLPSPPSGWFPDAKLRDGGNLRTAHAEAEVFIYEKLGCGFHPRGLEQMLHKEYLRHSSNPEDSYSLAFFDAAMQIVRCLYSRGHLVGIAELEDYEKKCGDLAFIFNFEKNMRRRISNFAIVRDGGISEDRAVLMDREPGLTEEQLKILNKMVEDTEEIIEKHHADKDSKLAVEDPETYLKSAIKSRSRGPANNGTSGPSTINPPSQAPPLVQGPRRLGPPFMLQNSPNPPAPSNWPPSVTAGNSRPIIGEDVPVPPGVLRASLALQRALSGAPPIYRTARRSDEGSVKQSDNKGKLPRKK